MRLCHGVLELLGAAAVFFEGCREGDAGDFVFVLELLEGSGIDSIHLTMDIGYHAVLLRGGGSSFR